MRIDFILQKHYLEQPWVVKDDPTKYENLEWQDNATIEKPSEEHLLNLWNEKYEVLFQNEENQRKRFLEYPKPTEMTHALWKKVMNNDHITANELNQKIKEIDDKYPITIVD